jgi:putative Holliday junction resolvase
VISLAGNSVGDADAWPHLRRAVTQKSLSNFIGITAAMALFNMAGLRGMLAKDQRLIGLDPGRRTIGVALSDVGLVLASPYGSLRRGKLRQNAAEVLAIATKEGAGGLVVGLAVSLDGTLGPAAQAARDWTLALSDATGLPAALWDERLSSAAVNRLLIEQADLSRRKRTGVVDSMAAAWILQAALDASRPGNPV